MKLFKIKTNWMIFAAIALTAPNFGCKKSIEFISRDPVEVAEKGEDQNATGDLVVEEILGDLTIVSEPEKTQEYNKNTPGEINVKMVVRDFKTNHPDFETEAFKNTVVTKGLIKSTLDNVGKPVFNGKPGAQITDGNSFSQWFRDVPGINMKIEKDLTLPLNPVTNVFSYANNAFFPIDNQGFGNEASLDRNKVSRNFHFTVEITSQFTYRGGEVFKFTGDDDVWVFIDKKLAVDIGGLHNELSDSVNLDTLGLEKGRSYEFKMFFAERHTDQSNFRIDTSLQLTKNVPYSYQVEVASSDSKVPGNLEFSLIKAPAGMNIDNNGLISWQPNNNQLGETQISIQVKALDGRIATQDYTLVVVEKI